MGDYDFGGKWIDLGLNVNPKSDDNHSMDQNAVEP